MIEWMKYVIVRSPLEDLAKGARRTLKGVELLKHPEMYEVWMEETRIARLVGKLAREDSNCVDVGSHLGSILSLFMRHAPRGRHIAFEPNPRHARWLERKFPEVEVRQQALGDSSGELSFHILDGRSGFSGLRRLDEPGERVREIVIKVDRLDDVVGPDYRVDLLKVVVEGAELSVLRGAEEILRRDRPSLLFECVPVSQAQFGATPAELFGFLTWGHSYAVYLIKQVLDGGGPLDLEGFEDAMRYPFKAFKFVAIPAS